MRKQFALGAAEMQESRRDVAQQVHHRRTIFVNDLGHTCEIKKHDRMIASPVDKRVQL